MEKFQDQVTVIINNRDLLSWPKAMCAEIERMHNLREIIILDNGSSNRALFRWYKECPYKVEFLDNLGHKAPWVSGVLNSISTDLYVVTDPDLDLSGAPDDTLIYLATLIQNNPALGKVGLSLRTDDVPSQSPYFQHVLAYEASQQAVQVPDASLAMAPVDTTFAMYDRRFLVEYRICGARAMAPYTARHIPWYVERPDDEFLYYLEHAESNSSSYIPFTGFRKVHGIEALYQERKTGKVSTKWESYFSIYEACLSKFREKPISLFEIGVQNGGSLEIWSKYFINGVIFVGCDVNPEIGKLSYEDHRIALVAGVASDFETVKKVAGTSPDGFDVIIDDGSHRSLDTISNFLAYFDLLKPGGIYIVEDMHCAYWSEYDGGYFNQRSAASFFKCLFDLVNIEHCRNDFTVRQLFQTFFGGNSAPQFLVDGLIYSISAYNSVYVIQKSNHQLKPLLGKVVIAGDAAIVDSQVLR
jgi:hypothetical protein